MCGRQVHVNSHRRQASLIVHSANFFRCWPSSLSFTHILSRVSKSLTALFGMRHLTYGTNFLHLFAFLVSRPPQNALLHRQALTLLLNWWLACLTGSSILLLKLTFSPDPFPRNLPLSLYRTDFTVFIQHVYGSLWR